MSIEICLDQYQIEKKYIRNNKSCYIDPARERFIQETPEEEIRQKVLLYVQKEMQVPLEMIEVEVPMCHFEKGSRGRADIIVYCSNDENLLMPVLVIECKAPNVPLTDDVFNQVLRYNDILSADTLMITNGSTTEIWSWNDEQKEFNELLEVPSYADLVHKENLVFDNSTKNQWLRPSFAEIHKSETMQAFLDYGWVGEGTPRSLYPFLINLGGFIRDYSKKIEAGTLSGINIVEDGGVRDTSFGNAAGGSWPGSYRYFIVEDKEKNNQIISLMVSGSLKCENHPKFGNRRGHTAFIVAIDDYDKSHNTLQLNLDDYISVNGSKYTIWHDGKITVGKRGACKKSEVIDFIRMYSPDLLDDQGRVFLGEFDNSKEISWEQPQTKEFIGRIMRYALIRDKFRKFKMKNTMK
ncbi:MAG: type I restriction enzyme HsdR N-terminal domain-containing protein [Sporomusaceae bacterium]|nr:type I restriction enzyme HsdR N-terminal domain-containing protein [Sporomusaceae bacterium]